MLLQIYLYSSTGILILRAYPTYQFLKHSFSNAGLKKLVDSPIWRKKDKLELEKHPGLKKELGDILHFYSYFFRWLGNHLLHAAQHMTKSRTSFATGNQN